MQLPPGVTPEHLEALRMVNLGVWAALNTFKVDHRVFTFHRRRYLRDIYLSTNPYITVRKCTQVGLTIWMILKVLHKLRFAEETGAKQAKKAGFYFPVHDSVSKFSKDRLKPLLDTIPEFSNAMNSGGSIELQQMGNSSLYMSYMGGTATKDSTPMDIICLDEVRLMDPAEITQVEERLSGSFFPEMYKISTAGTPNDAIDRAFLQGNQYTFHTHCNCSDGVVLSDVFPECIDQKKQKSGVIDYFYRCPKCGMVIEDPQNGVYLPHNPSSDKDSFHIHQMLSPTRTAKQMWDAWVTTDNPKEFQNAKLGKPFVDKEKVGTTDDKLEACINPSLEWRYTQQNTAMGVDQRSGQLHVVIGKNDNGKRKIVHVEVIDNKAPMYRTEDGRTTTPFNRLRVLMNEFDVNMCVLDALPNINEAKEFADSFPTRVFLSFYKDGSEVASWSDKKIKTKEPEKPTTRMSSEDLKYKWTVSIDRYKAIEFALRLWEQRRVECPNPRTLIQDVRNEKTGHYEPTHVVEKVFFLHLKSVSKEMVSTAGTTGSITYRWINLGLDPHFLHAWTYCAIAMERRRKIFSYDFV